MNLSCVQRAELLSIHLLLSGYREQKMAKNWNEQDIRHASLQLPKFKLTLIKSKNSIGGYTMNRSAKQSEVFLKPNLRLSPGTKWWGTCIFLSLTLLSALKCSHLFCSETSDHSRCWPVGQRKHYKLTCWADSKCLALSSLTSTIKVGDTAEKDPLRKLAKGRTKK